MTGKVFEESSDVYQDQARVLFDYYRQAAERIVREEMAIERQIVEVQAERKAAFEQAEGAHKSFVALVVGAVAGTVVGMVLLIPLIALAIGGVIGFLAFKKSQEEQAGREAASGFEAQVRELETQKASIRRDYRVERIGVAYVPVARRVRSGERSYVVDLTGEEPETKFALTLINQPDELKEAMAGLKEHIGEMPVVEGNADVELVDTSDYSTSMQDVTLHDYMGAIDRQVRSVGHYIDDARDVSVSVPVVTPASERYEMLEEYTTDDVTGHPVIEVFDDGKVMAKVDDFSELGALNQQSSADGSGDIDFFVDVMRQLAEGVDVLSRSRTASVSRLLSYSTGILQNVLKASFDQYSPVLEAAEIERIRNATFNYADEVRDYRPFALKESSRVRYDIFSDTWVADNGTRTSFPFGMHQIDTEVLMPVIANLMQENRSDRIRIYSEIQDQKTDYLNKWHRDTDDFFGRNRTEANALIQRMNEAYAEFVESYTNYRQQSAAIAAMKQSGSLEDAEVEEADNQDEVIEGFQVQTNQARAKQEEFTQFMDRIREDIDECAARFGHVEFYDASLRDGGARDVARAQAHVRDLDARRQRLAAVSPYLAENGFVPPEPRINDRLDEDFVIDLTGQVDAKVRSLMADGVGAKGVSD